MTRASALLALSGLVGLLTACSAGSRSSEVRATVNDPFPPAEEQDVGLRIDVLPSDLRLPDAEATGFRVLPQTSRPLGLRALAGATVDVGAIDLRVPQLQTGAVTGFRFNPQIVALPGSDTPVVGTVTMRQPGTLQSYAARTDDAGAFALWLVPQEVYRFEIVPDDPLLPAWSTTLPVGARTVDQQVDLGAGVPVFGRVTTGRGALVGARVHVVDAEGLVSASAVTDVYGLYQVRVSPGTWTVVTEGRERGEDPTLTTAPVTVGDAGAEVDLAYPTVLSQVLVEGRVSSEGGARVPGALVRLTSEALEGFEGLDARWTADVPTADNGTFLARAVPGRYTVEILPPAVDEGPDYTPVRFEGVQLTQNSTDLGEVALARLIPVDGRVVDPFEDRVPNAIVSCAERGFDGRGWSTYTEDGGRFSLELPAVPLDCTVEPPGDRPDLAPMRVSLDPAQQPTPRLQLSGGQLVEGVVRFEGEPEPFALVEVRDLDDALLGVGFTDEETGRFSVRVDLSSGRVRQDTP